MQIKMFSCPLSYQSNCENTTDSKCMEGGGVRGSLLAVVVGKLRATVKDIAEFPLKLRLKKKPPYNAFYYPRRAFHLSQVKIFIRKSSVYVHREAADVLQVLRY